MAARRLILFVLTIFALQLSWTAVAVYCTHETGSAAQHFGHHSAESDSHQPASAEKDKPSDTIKTLSMHSHCSSCWHASLSFGALPAALAVVVPMRVAPATLALHYSSSYAPRPERPQWIAAV